MATGAEWSCPICREASGNIAYVGSCLHQFCRACILRWARKNPSCPLCRRTVHTIIYPAPSDQGFVEMAVPQPSVSRTTGRQEEPGAAEPQAQARVAGFPPETWAFFFRNHADILRPLEVWLNEVLWGDCWWDVAFAQGRILSCLCRYGLHEEALARELQPFPEEQTAAFVRHLIEVAAEQCSQLARCSMGTAPQQAGLGAIAFPSTSGAQEERREGPGQAGPESRAPGRAAAAVPGSPGSPAGAEAAARRILEQPTRSRAAGRTRVLWQHQEKGDRDSSGVDFKVKKFCKEGKPKQNKIAKKP